MLITTRQFQQKVLFLLFIIIFSLRVEGQELPLPNETPYYTLFLIGDAGKPLLKNQDPTLSLLEEELQKADSSSSIIFLGDNIYQRGLPDLNHSEREYAEKLLLEQLKILKDFKGNSFIVPGNHDWDRSGRDGWKRIRNQEQFVEQYLDRGNTFLPDNGCPGPVEVSLSDSITLVVIDTQWFLHGWEKPGVDSDCAAGEGSAVIAQLEDILSRNINKKIVVASHHPVYSAGEHNGHNTWRDHIFPFTNLNHNLYIPVPVIGSIYPIYRKWFGDIQDIPHPKNRALMKALVTTFKQHPAVIHVAGHEHALQHFFKDSINYIVSGSGSKLNSVKKRSDAEFAASTPGFSKVYYYESGEVWMEFFTSDETKSGSPIIYRSRLATKPFVPVTEAADYNAFDFSDSSVFVPASKKYSAGAFKSWLLGSNYRKEWETLVKLPLFELTTAAGGLKIKKLGGGMQTLSLHLEAEDGKQFKLRSIEKYTEHAIPEVLKGTLANDMVQDQISAAHPYGALVVPELAKAAGIFYTESEAYFIPDDPRFGKYRSKFKETSALLEIKPDEDLSELSNLGNSENIVGTQKVLDLLVEGNDNKVDQNAVLRARLFDMVIGDWDRHDGQWRWATYKVKRKGTLFKPIPQDRDQAFFVNEGLIPNITSRKWIMPKLQGFDDKIRDVAGFNHNARYFDRSFLNEPSLEEWLAQADSLQSLLTDEAIENAIKQWPDTIYALSGEEIIRKLKSRRDIIKSEAEKYYKFLSKEVDITGSNKNEYFEIIRADENFTIVSVYKLNKNKEKEHLMYNRKFKSSETDEIRLYGLSGNDLFEIKGEVKNGPLLRIIGGEGDDKLLDYSKTHRSGKKVYFYDDLKNNEIVADNDTKDFTSADPGVNYYNRKSFEYDYLGPLLSIAYNRDDGLFLGAGVLLQKKGFRKEPYAVSHRLTGNYSIATSSYNFRYYGSFTELIGKWTLDLDADVKAPNYVNNFFGFGNETSYQEERSIDYYRVRYEVVEFDALLKKKVGNFQTVYVGPGLQSVEVQNTPNRFLAEFPKGENNQSVFERKNYSGIRAGYIHDKRDNSFLPSEGFYVKLEGQQLFGLNAAAENFSGLYGEMSYFWSFRVPSIITLATRVGGGRNFGSYEFFQAQTLGGLENLRGYRRTRFSGKSSFYNNFEARIKLFSFRSYLFPGYAGILGFNDIGRVWVDEKDSDKWHWGYGGGIWVSPFNKVVLSFMYGFSEEDALPIIKLGFFF